MRSRNTRHSLACFLPCAALAAAASFGALAAANPVDPGVRTAPTDNGPPVPLPGLGADELAFFEDGLARFNTIEVVSGALPNQGNGLGPRFNSNSCASCHSQPYVGRQQPRSKPAHRHRDRGGSDQRDSLVHRCARTHPRGAIRRIERRAGRRSARLVRGQRPADAGSCAISAADIHARRQSAHRSGRKLEHRVSHSDADPGRRIDRGDPGIGHPREHGGECRTQQSARCAPATPTPFSAATSI